MRHMFNGSLLPVFCVRVSMTFQLLNMFVHYTFSLVWVAEWPPFWDGATHSVGRVSICNFSHFPYCF